MPDKDRISELLDDYAEAYAAYQTTEGNPRYLKAMQDSKAKITQLLLEERQLYAGNIAKNILKAQRKYKRTLNEFDSGFNHGIWFAVDTIGESIGKDEYAYQLGEAALKEGEQQWLIIKSWITK